MKAEIISIGDELLIGQVINTNASWIAEQLNLVGIRVYQITTIADEKEHIINALDQAKKNSDVIIITGGLGPTNDDVTKKVLSDYFKSKLVFHQQTFEDIQRLFKLRGWPMNDLNKKQAEIPQNCTPITNLHGTAPGMWFEQDSKIFVSLPGVPFEMKPMVTNHVIPWLAKKNIQSVLVHKTILTQGVGESFLSEKIHNWEMQLPKNIKLAYLPSPGIVRLRLTGSGTDRSSVEKQIAECVDQLNLLIPDYIYGYDDDTLEKIIGSILAKEKKTLSTAESCTGGYVAHRITSVPGSSLYFKGSIIAYSNEIKTALLGVQDSTLKQNGAVSEQTVIEMAKGIQQRFSTDYAIAVSGVAGPDGGSAEKPVGTTWIAVVTPDCVVTQHFLFGEHRERNIHRAALSALNMLRKQLVR